MKERIINYRKSIDDILSEGGGDVDWEEIKEIHLTQIGFFQHERLIHLLVTLAFAIMTVGTIFTLIITEYMYLLVLAGLFFVLLIPYVFHYYTLENEIQKMYGQYDEIVKRQRKL